MKIMRELPYFLSETCVVGFLGNDSLGYFTTNLVELYKVAPQIPMNIQIWMFLAFGFSFAIKVPLFPLHTWLPDAHVQAPTAGSVILAGVLLKMGTYGLLRFNLPLFPEASIAAAPYISVLAIIGIIYGALVSMVQTDIKVDMILDYVQNISFHGCEYIIAVL